MAASFFFYDLETTGIKSREGRIMQFAGQRTDMNLKPIGDSENIYIKLTLDVLPDPEAVLLTGITPQQTILDGITEYEFLKYFDEQVATPGTIFVGYNTVRFDDEFMRSTLYRNFYDPYEWHWKDNRSRWDLLDVVRMTRALRPDGIEWPFNEEGLPTNRLELITKLNGLDHEQAHDALNDVMATIAVAKMIRDKEPKLFDYLLGLRGKKEIKKFLDDNPTFVYSSGKYSNEFLKTAVVQLIHKGDDQQGAVVWDLRHDPEPFATLTPKELAVRWGYTKDPDAPTRLPVKTLKYNRCPAICPTGLIADEKVQERLGITLKQVEDNKAKLKALPDLLRNIVVAQKLMDDERQQSYDSDTDADENVYGGLYDDHDRNLLRVVRGADPSKLTKFSGDFHDKRLQTLLPRYKARNFPGSLTDEERKAWDSYRNDRLFGGGDDSRLAEYFRRLAACAAEPKYADKQFLLEELQLYGQSLLPTDLA
jgi:exodeoxyribonuclease-1